MRNPKPLCFRLNPQRLLVMAPASDKLWHDGSRCLSRLRSPQRRLHAVKAMAGRGFQESDDREIKNTLMWMEYHKISMVMYSYDRYTTICDLISLRMPCFGHHFDNVRSAGVRHALPHYSSQQSVAIWHGRTIPTVIKEAADGFIPSTIVGCYLRHLLLTGKPK